MKEDKTMLKAVGLADRGINLFVPDDEDEWHEIRRMGITGTDISVITGTNPYKTQKELLAEKLTGEKREQNEAMFWGTKLEEVVANVYAERSGCAITEVKGTFSTEKLPSEDGVPLLGNVDRLILDYNDNAVKILEIKTASSYSAKRWSDGAIPAWYADQVMWYMGITGIYEADFAVLIGGNNYITRTLYFNEERFEEMKEAAVQWYKRHVIDKEPISSDFNFAPEGASGCVYREDLTSFVSDYQYAVEAYKQADKDKEAAKQELITALGNDRYISTGAFYAKLVSVKGRAGVDVEKLKKEHPEIYLRYEKEANGYDRIDIRETF